MIINLTKSKLFTVEPDVRFAREHRLPRGTWVELWRRYKLLGYTTDELCEYLLLKTGKNSPSKRTARQNIKRWIIRTEIYTITSPVLKKGARSVNSCIFGPYEEIVLNELAKHMRAGDTKGARTII